MGGAGQAPQAVGKLNSAEQSAESHRRRGFSDIIHKQRRRNAVADAP